MYTGTMIDDLISMVARAEEQAQAPVRALPEPLELTGPLYAQYYEPRYFAPMVGAA